MEELKNNLISWNNSTSERQKLQHSYLAIAILVVLAAGIVSLIDADSGHRLTFIALGSVVVFLINGVVWHLLHSALLAKLPSTRKRNNKR